MIFLMSSFYPIHYLDIHLRFVCERRDILNKTKVIWINIEVSHFTQLIISAYCLYLRNLCSRSRMTLGQNRRIISLSTMCVLDRGIRALSKTRFRKVPSDTRAYLRTRNCVSAEVCFSASRGESFVSTIALTTIRRNIMSKKNNGRGKSRGLCLINQHRWHSVPLRSIFNCQLEDAKEALLTGTSSFYPTHS